MRSALLSLLALILALAPQVAKADPADIDAAARGVVRVVLIGTDGREVYPVSHGTGFAVTPDKIVTNAHVVREALLDDTLTIAIVPPDGDESVYARPISVDPRSDLALLQITGALRIPPLTIAARADPNSGEVSAVGYPMNVDRAQGLEISEVFEPQPPVKTRGYISGARPARQFDSLLHTAAIARGNSGGPLLDSCGRVIGVNSFGADSDGADAEFYFAVSIRELVPFLRKNNVEPGINDSPCRSLADLNAAERQRMEREQAEARQALAARAEEQRKRRERAQLEAELEVLGERENAMALALILFLVAAAAGYTASLARARNDERKTMIAITIGGFALLGSLGLWFTRPGLSEIDRRVAAAMLPDGQGSNAGDPNDQSGGTMICALDESRSRITGAQTDDIEFAWAEDGCVNTRTQYGLNSGIWSRVLVPDDEQAVSVNSYDPASRTFRTDRYLLSRSAMSAAREARDQYTPPQCSAENAAVSLGDMQSSVLAQLPAEPNERLVYNCTDREAESIGANPLSAPKN